MPAGPRIRQNSNFGLTLDNPLTALATTFNSSRLANMTAVVASHLVVTLDPRAQNGEPEIVIVTAHTASATVATIVRGAYSTTARAHPVGTEWVSAPVGEDFTIVATSSTRPADPYEGQYIYEADTHRPTHRDNTQWLPGGPTSIVTSGTRPANPYTGQHIFESDTIKKLVWNGTLWQELDVVYFSNPASSWTPGVAFSDVGPTITLPAGKWMIVAKGNFDVSTGTARTYECRLFNSTDSTQLDTSPVSTSTLNSRMTISLAHFLSITSSKVIKMQALTSAVDGVQLLANLKLWTVPVTAQF